MRLRELTNNINQPLNEWAPLWAALDLLVGSRPAGAWSDRSPASQIYNALTAQGKDPDVADRIAKEFQDKIQANPNDKELLDIFKKITGDEPAFAWWDANATTTVAPGTGAGGPAGGAKAPAPADIISKVPDAVKDPAAVKELLTVAPTDASGWANSIGKITKGAISTIAIQKLASYAVKYALPAAAVVALLYGGKKLYDYMQTKNAVKEEATSGATVSSNIGVVVNPIAANAKIKRDKNGVPIAPQAKNPDGTAKSALDIKNNLMGGKTIKR
jgi:hypothetical protein|tara:strand:- start:234 stop:1052 length:819 start_codon:yes stop_codon:yes gene_type:complete